MNLFKNQPDVLTDTKQTTMTEWNLAHHLANEIAKYLFWLNHDIEVVKRNYNLKRPDIIFHKRGSNLNFLVIELKTGRDIQHDMKRIRNEWMKNLGYRLGASVVISMADDWQIYLFDRNNNGNKINSQNARKKPLPLPCQLLVSQAKAPFSQINPKMLPKHEDLIRQIKSLFYKMYEKELNNG